jgi:zinc/manganese transport system substrate-binding protein
VRTRAPRGRSAHRRAPAAAAIAAGVLAAGVLAAVGCTVAPPTAASDGPVPVVATTNVWGSLLAQLGGSRVHETSIVSNPATDPHDYEPTPADARAIASARLLVENGAGYDAWAGRVLAASPDSGRAVVDVGRLVGVPAGGNPHRWYSPGDVDRVAAAITAGLQKTDPADATYFAARHDSFVRKGLARYHRLIAEIRAAYGGTPIGASESIVAPLAAALGLHVLTPPALLKAVSEGGEPSAADKTEADRQISRREIAVYVFNSQNATPDVSAQVAAARSRGIPVTSITETLSPASASFQDWQVRQLEELQSALHRATGR